MATHYFTDAQTLTSTQPAQDSEDAATEFADGSSAKPALQLTQFLAGLSIGLGIAQLLAPRAVGRAVGVELQPRLMRMVGVRELASGLGLLSGRQVGRWSWSRVAGDAMDMLLLGMAASRGTADLRRVSAAAAAVAGVAALDVYAARRLRDVARLPEEPVLVSETVIINAELAAVYEFWSRFENLPRFMRHLEHVTRRDERVSHWVARAPAGTHVAWDSEIVVHEPNKCIAWRTLPGSQVEHAGAVTFEPALGGRGTRMQVALRYVPPLGRGTVPLARLLGEEPRVQIHADLRRLKQLLETGEVASTAGQPSGRRSIVGRLTLGRWLS